MYKSKRIDNLGSAIFTEMANRKKQQIAKGKNVIDLSIGTPDLPPPSVVIQAMADALSDYNAFYYSLKGSQQLYQSIASWYQKRFSVILDTNTEILDLIGSQDGLAHLPLALIDPGDIVLVPDPGYPIYQGSVELAGGKIYPMPLMEQNSFLPDLDKIPKDIAQQAKLMIINYPSNPVAAIAGLDFFQKVVHFAKQNKIVVVHDLAYSELAFDGYKPPSFLQVTGAKDIGVEINSLSKSYNMAGARFGFMVGNRDIIQSLGTLKSNIDYGVFHVVQAGAIAALEEDGSHCADMAQIYQKRRDLLIEGFNDLGWKIEKPKASMFVWAKNPGQLTSREFAYSLLEEAGIVVIPGDAFGLMGEGYVRIALVQNDNKIKEAIKQLAQSKISF
ncbi:LL-diaminopimelate aminotransferase [Desulfuribacillus stibiiarsenatis]|uniref:LL-diaminopimelate aminotransferase n=1 Tax=Desulfuribacillus stibiiarsenatis TaxID=1390249 RepID=A0A1E5L3S1_9FIRM|nr:aminotransferase class I/II-fold pyridoxal phosphate-dependent enzyme [Desulfuribacillus stibiiarsenatis]OEH84741.1 LL-diaminopimelate aminotransferase [Desulfuribacillus stibiiarsenatis]